MKDKEALVNAKKTELEKMTKRHPNEKCSPALKLLIEKVTEICALLQEMYLDTRAEKEALEAEVKKLKSAIHSLTCD